MRVGAGAIGLGGLGQLELEVLSTLDGVEVVAGTDVSGDARAVFEREYDAPAYDDHEAMLAEHAGEMDVALIVTPHTLHYEQARACLEAGVHVYLEKPMVTDVADAVDLVSLANERELQVQVGYQRHFHPGFTEVKRLIDSGRIGDVHTVNAYLGQDWIGLQEGTWRVNPALSGGGQLYDTGSHLLDVLLWMAGATPKRVTAQMQFDRPRIDVNSALTIELGRDDGSDPILAGVTISGNGVDLQPAEGYAIWGTEGRITFDGSRINLAEREAAIYESTIDTRTDFTSLTSAKLGNFLRSVAGEAEPAVPGEFGLQVTALTEAAYRADETGRRIDVQSVIDEVE